ncbi:hypothetical protein C9J48_05380 [Photobacterium profundum]|nr:hypothetical protein C9J48_05380 [Photobacterium profundum]
MLVSARICWALGKALIYRPSRSTLKISNTALSPTKLALRSDSAYLLLCQMFLKGNAIPTHIFLELNTLRSL